jgi:hypothetical protein
VPTCFSLFGEIKKKCECIMQLLIDPFLRIHSGVTHLEYVKFFKTHLLDSHRRYVCNTYHKRHFNVKLNVYGLLSPYKI